MSFMVGDFWASALADGESGLRVRARMVKSSDAGEERMVLMTLFPCLPVAPRIRIGLDMAAGM